MTGSTWGHLGMNGLQRSHSVEACTAAEGARRAAAVNCPITPSQTSSAPESLQAAIFRGKTLQVMGAHGMVQAGASVCCTRMTEGRQEPCLHGQSAGFYGENGVY
jgi:hypothetical protein